MTYSHAIKLEPASKTGGLSIKVGEPFQISEKDPEATFRDLLEANAHPKGAILERVEAGGIRETIGLEKKEGVIIRTRVAGGKAGYTLLLATPFSERSSK